MSISTTRQNLREINFELKFGAGFERVKNCTFYEM